jgi:hypothetical protein
LVVELPLEKKSIFGVHPPIELQAIVKMGSEFLRLNDQD